MSEERLEEIKDSIEFQKRIVRAYGQDLLLVSEEQELYDEIIRLKEVIKFMNNDLDKYIKKNKDTIKYIKENSWYCYKDNEENLDRIGIEHILKLLGDDENETDN